MYLTNKIFSEKLLLWDANRRIRNDTVMAVGLGGANWVSATVQLEQLVRYWEVCLFVCLSVFCLNEVKQTSNYSRDNKFIIKAVTLCTEVIRLTTQYTSKRFQSPVQIYRPLCPPCYHSAILWKWGSGAINLHEVLLRIKCSNGSMNTA
jgi:hypothetical protein